MKNVLLVIMTYTFLMCTTIRNEITIEGDIYIKLIDVHSVYGLPLDKMNEFKNSVYKQANDSLSDSEKRLKRHFIFLIENEMFDKPHFKLKMDEKIINVYTSKLEFLKLNSVLDNLDRDVEKITVELKGIKKSEGFFGEPLYFAKEIISVKKTSGITEWEK